MPPNRPSCKAGRFDARLERGHELSRHDGIISSTSAQRGSRRFRATGWRNLVNRLYKQGLHVCRVAFESCARFLSAITHSTNRVPAPRER